MTLKAVNTNTVGALAASLGYELVCLSAVVLALAQPEAVWASGLAVVTQLASVLLFRNRLGRGKVYHYSPWAIVGAVPLLGAWLLLQGSKYPALGIALVMSIVVSRALLLPLPKEPPARRLPS